MGRITTYSVCMYLPRNEKEESKERGTELSNAQPLFFALYFFYRLLFLRFPFPSFCNLIILCLS